MVYKVTHTTTYNYNERVPLCHNLAMLSPRETNSQHCRSFRLDINPVPEIIEEYPDFFGNKNYYFVVEQEHEKLTVMTTSMVEKKMPEWKNRLPSNISWEFARDLFRNADGNLMDVRQYCFPTEITDPSDAIRAYARVSFTPARALFEAASDLMQRIHKDFKYTSGFTTTSTPLSLVMKERKGVCQDFAHLGIACFQSMGLAARYVSGYLETTPPPGKPKLTGADASHAWLSVYIPEMGWVDFDPTNNRIPDDQHIIIGWGRNYFDIIPLRGIIMSGDNHELKVSVDVERLET